MTKSDLFNVAMMSSGPVPEVPGEYRDISETVPPGPAAAVSSVGVITIRQSAITFAGAPVVVTLVWKVLGAAIPSLAASKLCALGLSILIGIAIYTASETPGNTFREKFDGYFFAFINSFAIAATVLGIESSVASVGFLPGP